MSRRNLTFTLVAVLVSAVCYMRTDHNRYGRYLSQALTAIDRWALEPVSQYELFDTAMRSIAGRLDEYSAYIGARDAEAFEAGLEQQFGGIGVTLSLDGQPPQLTVMSPPLFGSPALKAGIRARDRILAIDGKASGGMSLEQIVRRMRGPIGEPVELTILHENQTQPITLKLTRETIHVPSVVGDRRNADGSWNFRLAEDPSIGYVRVLQFGERTVEELEEVLQGLAAAGVSAAVLDLRDNAGGLLLAAVGTCELFLASGTPIVTIRGREGQVEEIHRAGGPGTWRELPLVVLVNRYSASASEIVGACLQDHGRAAVAGQRTWGKGTVQHVIPIEGGRSLLKLTVASYWRPSGQNIHRMRDSKPDEAWGVRPDPALALEMTEQQQTAIREARLRRDLAAPEHDLQPLMAEDPLVRRAVEHLRGQFQN